MFFTDEKDYACGLGVEATWDVKHGVTDDLCDPRLGDRDIFVKGIDGSAVLHCVEERLSGSGLDVRAHV